MQTPSINAVPDEAVLFIDRRLTFGEDKNAAIQQVRDLIAPEHRDLVTVEEMFYDEPSYTGFVFPVDKYFPAWAYPEDHPLVVAGVEARQAIGLPEAAEQQVELLDQRHLLGRQGRDPVDRLRPGRRGHGSHRQRLWSRSTTSSKRLALTPCCPGCSRAETRIRRRRRDASMELIC